MHKDELLQLHSLLVQVKRFFEASGLSSHGEFDAYEDLEVSPQHIHKSKTDHKRAVFQIGKGLSELVMSDEPEQQQRLIERFARMAEGGPVTVPASEQRSASKPRREPTSEELPAFAVRALSN